MNILKILGYCSKEEYEREVLSEFLNCLYEENPVKYGLESKEPDKPDVLVILPTKQEYYELVRILDRNWFNLRLEALMNRGKQVKVDPTKFGLPERDIVETKLNKTYLTNSKDMNLLLYYDTGILNGGYPPMEIKKLCDDLIKPLLAAESKFKEVYIFDRRSKEILWKN